MPARFLPYYAPIVLLILANFRASIDICEINRVGLSATAKFPNEAKPFPALIASCIMMKPTSDELELAICARSGNQEALAELIERVRIGLFALAYAELRHYDDAQDAVAASVYQICRCAANVRDATAMRGWMYSIVRNEAHRLRRGKSVEHKSLHEFDVVGVEDPSPILRLDIENALQQLPRDQAYALGLFYLRGWSIGEIARHLARPEGTIKYWLYQGRRRLAAHMEGYFPMEKLMKACIVAPEITPVQLQCITKALESAGFSDSRNAAAIHSVDDLFHTNTSPSVFMAMPGGSIGVSDEGRSKRIVFESEDRQLQINGLLSDRSIVRLAEPLAGCDFLILGERIAGHSAFELLPLIRAIAPNVHICLLLNPPVSDYTYLSSFVSGVTKMHTLRAHYSDLELQQLQSSFADVRTRLEPK